jgi:hypothetical protein
VEWTSPSLEKVPIILLGTCKLDSKVKTHNEISKKNFFVGYFGYEKGKTKALTPHTYVQGTTHIDDLHRVDPMDRLRPRTLFIINELMSRCQHHTTHHIGAMPPRIKFLHMKILIVSSLES